MSNKIIQKYVAYNKEFIEYDKFVCENEWLKDQAKLYNDKVSKNIVAEYYMVNKNEMKLLDKAYVISWISEYATDFKELNLAWIEKLFGKAEPMDYEQLDNPKENILNHNGEVFFAVSGDGQVIGTTAMVVHGGEWELAKMSIKDSHQGKGYSHLLMRAALAWTKDRGIKNINIFGNTKLEGSIALYKKYGFKTIFLGPSKSYKRGNIHLSWTSE